VHHRHRGSLTIRGGGSSTCFFSSSFPLRPEKAGAGTHISPVARKLAPCCPVPPRRAAFGPGSARPVAYRLFPGWPPSLVGPGSSKPLASFVWAANYFRDLMELLDCGLVFVAGPLGRLEFGRENCSRQVGSAAAAPCFPVPRGPVAPLLVRLASKPRAPNEGKPRRALFAIKRSLG